MVATFMRVVAAFIDLRENSESITTLGVSNNFFFLEIILNITGNDLNNRLLFHYLNLKSLSLCHLFLQCLNFTFTILQFEILKK